MQADAASTACEILNNDVQHLMTKVNQFGEARFEGAAADNAQSFAGTVIMPLLRGASALFDDIPIAMHRLPNEYKGRVDHKGWTTEELEEKIREYEQAAKDAQKAANNAEKVAKDASNSGVVGAGIVAAATKCVAGFEKSMESAQKGANKYKKILRKFNRFNVFSPSIFSEVEQLQNNLTKGKKVAESAYNPKTYKFSIPKNSQLQWANYLNKTYEEHEKLSSELKSIPKDIAKDLLSTAVHSLNDTGRDIMIGGFVLGVGWTLENLSYGIKHCVVKYNSHDGYYDVDKIKRGMNLSDKLDNMSGSMKEIGQELIPDMREALRPMENIRKEIPLSDKLKGMGTTIRNLFDEFMKKDDIVKLVKENPELGKKIFILNAALDVSDELKNNSLPDATVKGFSHALIESVLAIPDVAWGIFKIREEGLSGILRGNLSEKVDDSFDRVYDNHEKAIHKAMQDMGKATLAPQSQVQ